jgi:diguanylate cyclase
MLYFDVQATPVRNTNGDMVSFMLIMRDSTQAERKRATLEQTIRLDSLTGLYNRAAVTQEIEHLMSRVESSDADGTLSHPFAVLFIDIDEFKSVNDTYGHEAGDRFLRAAGAALQKSLRPGDFAARIGGDEFAAVLPGIDQADAAREVAARIIDSVKQLNASVGLPAPITCSVGIAFRGRNSEGVRSATQLLRAADQAMYTAKRNGKNQVALNQG